MSTDFSQIFAPIFGQTFRQIIGGMSGNTAFSQEYQTLIAYANSQGYTLPSPFQQYLQNKLIGDLKDSGIWRRLDTFYMFANNGSSDFATLNWKNPALFQCSRISGPTWTNNRGFKGDGVSSYLDTNYNPVVGAINYTQNDASRTIGVITASTLVNFIHGVSPNSSEAVRNAVGTTVVRLNQSSTSLGTSINMSGAHFFNINRVDATNLNIFIDTTSNLNTATSSSLTPQTHTILRSASAFGDAEIYMFSEGASLVSQNTAYYNAIQSYMTEINYDSDYIAVLDRALSLNYSIPSTAQRPKQNTLISSLKSAGVWAKSDIIYVPANDGGSDFATLNWKNPSTFQITRLNSPIFLQNQGLKGDGVSASLDTNFIPNSNGVQYTLNDASRNAWISIAASGGATGYIDGLLGNTGNLMRNASNIQQRINCTTNNAAISLDLSGTGLVSLNRTDSTNITAYKNTTATATTQTSTSLNTQHQTLLSSSSNFGDPCIGFYCMSKSLIAENTAFYNALNTYMGSL